ncbi:Pectate lyase [Phytophthora cinnamomi]|uniref:Pectate lyase n=1 Tax=Phytophthora cinnamomi TaxID=4785 RepID=UPI003559AEA8|nr:Pectate lyase [Phytophthora cinnamomi]
MVKIRTATVASVVVLLGTTLSAALAEDSWGDMAQYGAGSSVSQQQQSTGAPTTWEASKKSDDEATASSGEDKKSKKSDDETDAPSTSWTQAPSNGDSGKDASETPTDSSKQDSGKYWKQGPTPSWGSSKKSDNGGDDKSDSSSTGANQPTQAPSTSQSSGKSDDDNNDAGSSKSSKTSKLKEDSWKQEPVTSSGASQTSGETTSSTGSQTTGGGGGGGGGGGSSTPSTSGGSVPDGTWPTSAGTVQFAEAHIVKAGEVFDGKMKTYERSDVTCEGQTESGASTAVFKLEPGSTLKNVIIGKNQMEGVHCDKQDCTIENVWWDDVCEDALSVKGGTASSVTTVTGGGARSADDKVIQHNGFGTVKIDGFYGEDISKLYRSCGTCGDKQRKVSVSNVYVVNPDNAIVTVNKNWKDEATLSNIWVKSAGKKKVKICQWSQGNADGEPSMLGDGPSPPLCQYSESDVHLNGDVSKAGGSTPSQGSTPATSSEGSGDSEQLPGTVSPDVPESSGNDDGNNPSQQTQWTESPAASSEGSADGGDDKTAESNGADNNEASASYGGDDGDETSAGSQTSGDETSQGSSTSQTTPSTSSGTVPDGTWPTSMGSVKFTAPRVIKAGEVFDGKMQTFDRSDITCTGGEGQKDSAVFLVEAGGTLKNAIIGKNQKEGVHCDKHDCTIENVWWDDVCEDALSIKGGTASSVTTVTNCGARSASDKVVQHNGYGTVKIDGFYAEDFGKLYRSCGTCGDIPRTVTVKNVYAVNPIVSVVTVNKNYGDKATLSNIWVKIADGGDDTTAESNYADDTESQTASKANGENGDSDKKEKDTSSKSSNGDNKEQETPSKSSKGDKKSDNTESDSAQQQVSSGDESVMQSEVGGEADLTMVKSEAATKESAFSTTTTTSTSKCNIRRRRN